MVYKGVVVVTNLDEWGGFCVDFLSDRAIELA